ncbi:MAG: 16S rRNA processing protein RimM [Proteobacteria bacterium]|nr:16S rRNA processing protein RimM [Pseudomonadota bacterium]
MADARVKLGVIRAAHGVRGQVKIFSISGDPEELLAHGPLLDARGRRYALTRHGVQEACLIASIHGIADRNEAEKLKGTELFAIMAPQKLRPDEFRTGDLIGLTARTQSGAAYGTVHDTMNFGAGDILEIERENGEREMLPFTGAFFGEVNISQGYLVVIPPGYLENSDEPQDETGED